VRVRHKACGLNFLDVYQRSGLYKIALPSGMGNEGAGVVEAIGAGVTQVKVGDASHTPAARRARIRKSVSCRPSARGSPGLDIVRNRRRDDAEGHDGSVHS